MEKKLNKTLKEIIGEKDLQTINSMLTPKDATMVMKYHHAIRLANTMDYCFWIGWKGHKTLYVNKIYQKLTEYSLEECIGKPADFCFDEESKKKISEHHKLRKKGITSKYEAAYITKSGKKIPVLIVGAPTKNEGSYGIHIDIREIKKLEKEKLITDQIVRNTNEAIVVLDAKKRVKLWNAGAEKIFGYKEKEVLNKELAPIVVPSSGKEENISLLAEVEKRKFIRNFETTRQTKNGKLIDVAVSISKVTNGNSEFFGYLVLYRDISQQKRVNTELQKRFETIQDAYKELGLQKRQADYIYEIVDMAASKSDFKSLARLIISAASMLTKCDGAILRLYDKASDTLNLIATFGVSDKWKTKGKIKFFNSIPEDAFKNRRPIIIHDIDSYPKHKGLKLVKEHGFKTLISIPFIIEEEFLGSLNLYATDPSKFRLIETDFIERFGKQCAVALYSKIKKGK